MEALDFNPQPRRAERYPPVAGEKRGWTVRRLAVTVPAREYRIATATTTATPLNLFERFMLLCCRGGVRQPDAIHAISDLRADLCERVLHDLWSVGLIDNDGAVTTAGDRALQGLDWRENPPLDVSYVYQLSDGSLLPTVVTPEQRNAAAQRADERRPKGIEWLGPFRLSDIEASLPKPTHDDLVRVVARHRELLHEQDDPPHMDIEVCDVGTQPQRVLLLTLAYAPATATSPDDYAVCDPLRPKSDNPALYRALRDVDSDRLRPLTLELTKNAMADNAPPPDGPSMERACYDMGARFGNALARHAQLQERLIWAQEGVYSARDVLERDSNSSALATRMAFRKAVTQAAQSLGVSMEGALHVIHERWPYEGDPATQKSRDSKADRMFNVELLDAAAREVGFQPRDGARFTEQMPDKARTDLVRGRVKKNPLLDTLATAALLRASRDADHPFRRLASRYPHLLHDLRASYSRNRNPASHYNEDNRLVQLDEVQRDLDLVLDLVEAAILTPND